MQKILMLKYSYFNRRIIIFCLILSVFLLPLSSFAATIDELEQQKSAATQKANELKNQAANKQGNINNIASLVKKLSNDITSYQSQINTTQKNSTKNEKTIVETENQIQIKQAELEINMKKQTEAIQTMYVMGRKSTIETLIASDSFSEAMARQQYLSALSEKIESMMKDIKQLKGDLEAKRDSLKQRKLELSIQREQLVSFKATITAQKSEQATLLNGALAEKNAILTSAKQAEKEATHLSQAIYDELSRQSEKNNETITTGPDQGYTAYSLMHRSIDQPDEWRFLTRECVSYTAYYMNVILKKPFHNMWPPGGDANDWPQLARQQGYSVTKEAKEGAIISWTGPLYKNDKTGHVAVVEKVNSNGTIKVSEYNRIRYSYSERDNVNPASSGEYWYIY